MQADKFKAAQEPIKQKFKENAEAALLTLRAQGSANDSNVIYNVATPRGTGVAGIHPKCGGFGKELGSGEMLLEALVACAGISLKAAAAVLHIPVKAATVSAEGDVDLRGSLGVTPGVPVGFNEIQLRFDIESKASKAELDQLLAVTEQDCAVFQFLQNSPKTRVQTNVQRPCRARHQKGALRGNAA